METPFLPVFQSSTKDATNDNAFIKRTMDIQNDFTVVDEEGDGSW